MELVVLVAITLGVIGLAGRLPDAQRVKRELARAHIQPIAELADGRPAAIRGMVEPDGGAAVFAPLGRARCVHWLVVFDEVGVGGDFRELGRIDGGVAFLLRDRTGVARIVPEAARLALPGVAYTTAISGLAGSANKPLLELMRQSCKPPNYPTSALRATEYVITVGAVLTIAGACTREPDPRAAEEVTGYRAQLPTRPVLSGTRRSRLLVG